MVRLHRPCARALTEGRKFCQGSLMESIVEWTARILLWAVGMAVASALMLAWCMLVFLLTGRLPWMVRKYF